MPLLTGLAFGLSLIIAIGAQNAYVLRQGVRREHVFVIALICALSDAVLIFAGVSGIGFIVDSVPWLITVVRWVGVAFLVGYALLALRRAFRPADTGLVADEEADPSSPDALAQSGSGIAVQTSRRSITVAVLTTLAITWLNPHVYLDTLFLLGSVAQTQGDDRWLFGVGAVLGSFLWFFALAYGARYLGRWLSTPRAWRILDGTIAVVMLAIAANLAFGG